jgi:hypothetical protein
MISLDQLARHWFEEAERLRHRYGNEPLASLTEAHARELTAALRESRDHQVTIAEASSLTGYSRSHLRRLLDTGAIPNVGARGAPRVRVRDLPYKATQVPDARRLHHDAAGQASRPGVRRISVA